MIKKLFLGFALFVAAASFTSCEQTEDASEVTITVGADDNGYVYSSEAQSIQIPVSVVPGVNYSAELVAAVDGDKVAWFKDIVYNESNASGGDFNIYLPANTTNAERKVKILFSAENSKGAEVTLTQEGSDVPTITVGDGSEEIFYNADEQVVKIPVSITPDANITVEIEAIEIGDDVSWVEDVIYTSTIASGSELAFLLPAYFDTEVVRSVHMVFSSEGAEDKVVTFTQEAFIPTVLTLENTIEDDPEITYNEYDKCYNYNPADGSASEKTFIVSTNKPAWSAEVKGTYSGAMTPDWIHVNVESGTDGDQIVVSLDSNDGYSTRYGKVEFTSNEGVTYISISQGRAPKAPSYVTLSYRDYADPTNSVELVSGDTFEATDLDNCLYFDVNHDGAGGTAEWMICETDTDNVLTDSWLTLITEHGFRFYTTSPKETAAERSVDLVMKYFDEEVFRITITDPASVE